MGKVADYSRYKLKKVERKYRSRRNIGDRFDPINVEG